MKRYFAAVDGLRALSICFVIYAHLSFANLVPKALRATSLGLSGVLIFFVISGYLITSKLLAEKRETGSINIGYFLLQRAFRLLPASFLVIFISWYLSRLGYVKLEDTALMHALTYTMDYYHPRSATLEHLWSLSVEEQFYLLWPFVILLSGLQRSRTICICVLLACPIFRIVGWNFGSTEHELVFRQFEMIADSLAIGCLLSMIEDKLPKWTCSSAAAMISLGVILVTGVVVGKLPILSIAGITIESVCAAFIIHSLTSNKLWISRCFAWRPVAWLGTVSYSLYLWQQLFLLRPAPTIPGKLFLFPNNLLGALLCATLSYYLLEKPVRNWGRRFRPLAKLSAAAGDVRLVNCVESNPT